MTAKDAIKYEMDLSLNVIRTYLSDLSDADLMLRPAKGANHLAWQLGHLIHSEADLLNGACPGAAPDFLQVSRRPTVKIPPASMTSPSSLENNNTSICLTNSVQPARRRCADA